MLQKIRPIHPFPARMAPELVWDELPDHSTGLRVLDPMSGSGTTLVAARLRGHHAIGFDRDPLAVLIAKTWIGNIDCEAVEKKAVEVLERARKRARLLTKRSSYPEGADEETRVFLDFWFDADNRRELAALAASIAAVRDEAVRDVLWCALSRLIITKEAGVSLAMDVSHSRPHKVYNIAPHGAFEKFTKAVKYITKAIPFASAEAALPPAFVSNEDARKMPLQDRSIDLIITSPPYLNAIDYLRGHKLSLVWMGHSIATIRMLRATNMGTEVGVSRSSSEGLTDRIMNKMCTGESLDTRHSGMLRRYITDLHALLCECHRVLRLQGKGVFVSGDCNLRRTFIANSEAIELLALEVGFKVITKRRRPLPENRRYLPPPGRNSAGTALRKRMREEVILTLEKPAQKHRRDSICESR